MPDTNIRSTALAEPILSIIETGGITLTPNHRLAQALNKQINQHYETLGKNAWHHATVEPAGEWLKAQFLIAQDCALTNKTLLTPVQEQVLWQQLLSKHAGPSDITDTRSLANSIQKAWNLTQQWRVPINQQPVYSADHQLFKQVTELFEQHCATHNWICERQIAEALTPLFEQDQLPTPSGILLYCFTEITPDLKALLASLELRGVVVNQTQPITSSVSSHSLRFDKHQDEIKAAAAWSKNLLDNDADTKIGIVIPDLAKEKQTVETIFTEQFSPETFFNDSDQPSPIFNLSAGTALTQTAIVSEALFLLELDPWQLSMEQISHLLLSPYLRGHRLESASRALLDQKLRSAGLRQYSCRGLIAQIEFIESRSEQSSTPIFCEFLKNLSEQFNSSDRKQTMQQWPLRFKQLLNTYGWPGDRTLTSTEYQTAARFQQRLMDLTQLQLLEQKPKEKTQRKTGYNSALGQLKSILSQDMYQVSGPDPSIQVLGLLEAAGLQFDHLWIMGLHDAAWPTQAEPNPFIPRPLQREHNLPRSSFERELEFCRKLTHGYQQSASHTVFSYPASEGESVLTISPLIRHIEPLAATDLVGAIEPYFQTLFFGTPNDNDSNAQQSIPLTIPLTILSDTQAPAISNPTIQRGGSSILKDQSCCPFSAFANHRLNAKPLDWPDPGLQPMSRGVLLHRALELIWEQLKNSDRLLQLSESELATLISDATEQSLKPFRQQWPELDQLLFLDTEQTRLQQAISLCLETEKQRLPFKVSSLEQKQSLQLGELNIHLKLDRVDELEDGSKICIDYKTGKTVSAKNWFGSRPQDPQLPLYALLQQDNLSALTFLQVFTNESKWSGITDQPENFPQLTPLEKARNADFPESWEQQLDFWRESLVDIAQQFIDGVATVDPFDGSKTCTYCHLKPLCRVSN